MSEVVAKLVEQVRHLHANESSGHDWEHVRRVWSVAAKLADEEGTADKELVALVALLHDVDDRKLTHDVTSEDLLPTARRLMAEIGLGQERIEEVCSVIQSMGYHKSLKGRKPEKIEAMIANDADYLEAIGAIGVARCCTYGGDRGRPIFLPDVFPETNLTAEGYIVNQTPSINHFFEKLLRIKNLMMTEAGKREAEKRHAFMVGYLRQFFDEVSAPKEWSALLDAYDSRA